MSRPTGVRNAQWDAAHTLPPWPVREYLPGLLAAANAPNATGAANWLAFYALHLCEFENVVAPRMRARRTAREQAGEKDLPPAIPPAADCAGVTDRDWADKARYLKRAAEMGDDKAVTAYASGILWMNKDTEDQLRDAYSNPQAIIEWQQDSKRLLIGAAASGSTNAMFALSDAYETGRLGEKNPALAYQYALITSM